MSLREFIFWKDETCMNCWYKWQSVIWLWNNAQCISCNNSEYLRNQFEKPFVNIEQLTFEPEWDII